MTKPEHLSLVIGGTSKLTLAPLGHLQKFSGKSNSNSNNSNKSVVNADLILAPQILPNKLQYNSTHASFQGKNRSKPKSNEEDREILSGYVSLPVSEEPVSDEEDQANHDKVNDADYMKEDSRLNQHNTVSFSQSNRVNNKRKNQSTASGVTSDQRINKISK